MYPRCDNCTDIYTEDQCNDSLTNISKTNTMIHMAKVRYDTICNNHETSLTQKVTTRPHPKGQRHLGSMLQHLQLPCTRVNFQCVMCHYSIRTNSKSTRDQAFLDEHKEKENNDRNDNLGVMFLHSIFQSSLSVK